VTTFPDAGTYFPDASSSYTRDLIGVVWVTFDPRTAGRGWDDANHLCGSCRSAEQCLPQHRRRPKLGGGPGSTDGVSAAPRQTGVQRNAHISYSNGAGPYDGSSGDVWKLDTSAGTWTRVSPVPSTDTANDHFGYGGLSVDAQHPDTIVVASLNSWWPDTIFFRSRDGGATWNRVWNWGPWPTLVASYTLEYSAAPWLTFGSTPSPCTSARSTNSLCPQPTPKLGWVVGSLEVDPFNSDHMLYGTEATIFGAGNLTAWDSGGSFQVSLNARGVEETSVQDLISPPAGPQLVSGVGDIGGFTHNDLGTPGVMSINPEIGTTTSLDYAALRPSFMVRVGNGNGGGQNIGFSSDGGTTWSPGNTAPSGARGGTVAAGADGSRVLWSPSGQGGFFTTDKGSTWTASTGVPAGVRIGADRVNPLEFYAFANGVFYISSDGGSDVSGVACSQPASSGHGGLLQSGAGTWGRSVAGRRQHRQRGLRSVALHRQRAKVSTSCHRWMWLTTWASACPRLIRSSGALH